MGSRPSSWATSDVSAAAKVLKNFSAEFKKPILKIGILDKAVVSVDQINALADLPSKDVLQAKLLGLLLAPASTLVRLINTPATQIAQVLKAHSENAPSGEAKTRKGGGNRRLNTFGPAKMWYAERLLFSHRADVRARQEQ